MRKIPFGVIYAAKQNNNEAISYIMEYFEGYIAKRCMVSFEDDGGGFYTFVDDDLRYQAEISLFASIFAFSFKEPPPDFAA